MNLLLVSKRGELLSLGMHLEKEGNKCKIFILEKEYKSLGDGHLEKVQSVMELKRERYDFVFSDYAQEHLPACLMCGSEFTEKVNEDIAYSDTVMRSVGFTPRKELVGGWWDGQGFKMFFSLQLYLGALVGDMGVPTLEGIVIRPSRANDIVLFSNILKKTPYRGLFIAGERIHAGYHPGIFGALYELIGEKLVRALCKDYPKMHLETSMALHVTLPPYPFGIAQKGLPIELEDSITKHMWFNKLIGKVVFEDVGWATARGVDKREARRRIMREVSWFQSRLPNLQCRVDVGTGKFSKIEK